MSDKRILLWTGILIAGVLVIWFRGRVYSRPSSSPPQVVFVTGGSGAYWQITVRVASGRSAAKSTTTIRTRGVKQESFA